MDHFRTYYESAYNSDEYYWGLEPAEFCDELIAICPPKEKTTVLDIGCGEGKDAVYFAKKGYIVDGFDITESGIRKTNALANKNGVTINAWMDDVNTFDIDKEYDIVYSTGTVQYLFDENKKSFFDKIKKITKKGGIVFFNVFVEKSFLELPPDWDYEEKMWKTGELFSYFADWEVIRIDETIFDCNSGSVPHKHCMDTIICKKR